MPKDSAARVSRSIWTAAATVAALLALGGLWAFYHGGLWLAAPTIVTLCATGLLAWHVANVARRADRNLQTAEGRLQAAAEALPDGLVVFDRNDRIAFYNSRFPALMTEALSSSLAIGKPFDDWIREGMARGPCYHPEMGEDFFEKRAAFRAAPRSEHSHRLADGRWVRIRENRTEDGGRVHLVSDITEERSRAAQLRLLALAVEQAGDPVEITGADHGFTYVNHAFETTTGYTQAEALGH
jgi:PAS domain-containing protein